MLEVTYKTHCALMLDSIGGIYRKSPILMSNIITNTSRRHIVNYSYLEHKRCRMTDITSQTLTISNSNSDT